MTMPQTSTQQPAESRNAAFMAGASHFESPLAGVLGMAENVSSSVSVGGLSEERSSTMAGQRFVRVSQNGRSAATSAAAPKFEGTA